MQKHAFLIIAHNNWGQLKKLIECLDSGTHRYVDSEKWRVQRKPQFIW